MDNLTALCAQLDVTMEYLCFGKTPQEEPSPEPPAKPSKSRLWTTGVAVLSLVLGFLLGFLLFHNAGEADYAGQLESVAVSNVEVNYDHENACYKISVLPSSVPEGMEVELFVEDINFPELAPKTISCQWDGVYYAGCLTAQSMNGVYRVTALFHLGNTQKNVLLIDFRPDAGDNGFGYTHLWEEQR